jgi:hypothetical protein
MSTSNHTKNSKRTLKLLTGLLFVSIFAFAPFIPDSGPLAGLSPVSNAWAGPNCDADGDGVDKSKGKCTGDDPDDSDPCVPNPEALACDSGGGGGGLGSEVSLDCFLEGAWGDASDDTIKNDKLGDYQDTVDRTICNIGGPSIPWPIRLGVGKAKGKPPSTVRRGDVVLGSFEIGTFDDVLPLAVPGTEWLSDLYPWIFEVVPEDPDNLGYPNMDEMDLFKLNVRPYRNTQTEESIHLLTPGEIYEMGMHFTIPETGIDRFSVSIASEHYEGNESFTGIACKSGHEAEILTHSPEAGGNMRDVSVYLWPDVNVDGIPDGYTVTTGSITVDGNGTLNVTEGSRWAAVCSAVGPLDCGNPRAPDNCNFLGYVEMQFTLHAEMN